MAATENGTTDAQTKKSMDYWGFLFRKDKCGTDKLNNLLLGIADYIVSAVYMVL
jgi:hypothetical protein